MGTPRKRCAVCWVAALSRWVLDWHGGNDVGFASEQLALAGMNVVIVDLMCPLHGVGSGLTHSVVVII
jgi:hypothetical protein